MLALANNDIRQCHCQLYSQIMYNIFRKWTICFAVVVKFFFFLGYKIVSYMRIFFLDSYCDVVFIQGLCDADLVKCFTLYIIKLIKYDCYCDTTKI